MSADHPDFSPKLRRQDVEAFLLRRFGDGARGISEMRAGTWSRVYAFRVDGRPCIARFSAHREDFEKDRLAAECSLQPDARGLPVPRVIELGETLGTYYAISERAFGRYLEDLEETETRTALPSLFAALDAARRVDLSGTTGFGLWGADGIAPHASWREALLDIAKDRPGARTHGWRRRVEASPSRMRRFDEVFEHLLALVECVPEERHLVHSDLDNRNVLVDEDGVTAIFDWGSSIYGDFLYDIAWLHFWLPWFPARASVDPREEARRHYEATGLAVPGFEARLRCYAAHIGIDGMAYSAFLGDWVEFEQKAERALRLVSEG